MCTDCLAPPCCQALPKVELHAHINGSLSDASLLRLVHERGQAVGITEKDVEDVMSKSRWRGGGRPEHRMACQAEVW
jgi:hypothetical protein